MREEAEGKIKSRTRILRYLLHREEDGGRGDRFALAPFSASAAKIRSGFSGLRSRGTEDELKTRS